MSKITSPILLDKTGQDLNVSLQEIRDVLAGLRNNNLNDNEVSPLSTWSSEKIIKTFATTKTQKGTSLVFEPIAATTIIVKSIVAAAGSISLTHSDETGTATTYTINLPAAGTYNWNTGVFTSAANNTTTTLKRHDIVGMEGRNFLEVTSGTLEITFKSLQTPELPTWTVINGGSSAEEQ